MTDEIKRGSKVKVKSLTDSPVLVVASAIWDANGRRRFDLTWQGGGWWGVRYAEELELVPDPIAVGDTVRYIGSAIRHQVLALNCDHAWVAHFDARDARTVYATIQTNLLVKVAGANEDDK